MRIILFASIVHAFDGILPLRTKQELLDQVEDIIINPVNHLRQFYMPFPKVISLPLYQNLLVYKKLLENNNHPTQITLWNLLEKSTNIFEGKFLQMFESMCSDVYRAVDVEEKIPNDVLIAGALHYDLYPSGGIVSSTDWCKIILKMQLKIRTIKRNKKRDPQKNLHYSSFVFIVKYLRHFIKHLSSTNQLPRSMAIVDEVLFTSLDRSKNNCWLNTHIDAALQMKNEQHKKTRNRRLEIDLVTYCVGCFLIASCIMLMKFAISGF